jgi:hypothetical protein
MPKTSKTLAALARAGLVALGLVALDPLAHSAAPTVQEDKALVDLREEQELILRQLERLQGTMELLLTRTEKEGRTRTADLLRSGLERLNERLADARTLSEWMESARNSLSEGQVIQAVEQQNQVVGELEALLQILLDAQQPERVEEKLETLREARERIGELADRQRQVQAELEALREQAKSPEQQALEVGLEALKQRQAELAQASRDAARDSGDMGLSVLQRELERIAEQQAVDAAVLAGRDPRERAALESVREALDRAAGSDGRAQRLERAAGELEDAAAAIEQSDSAAASAREGLERSAASSADAAEVLASEADRESAERAAEALEQGATEAAAVERGERSASVGAENLRAAAESLRAAAREQRASAQAERDAAASTNAAELNPDGLLGELREELAEDLERAREAFEEAAAARRSGDPQAEREAAEQAASAGRQAENRSDREALDWNQLGQALERSQRAQSQEARQLSQAAQALRNSGEQDPAAREALDEVAETLEEAGESLAQAAEAQAEGREQDAARAAEGGREALQRALEAMRSGREQLSANRESAGGEDRQAAAEEQRELAERLEDLERTADNAELLQRQADQLEEELEAARQAMGEAEQARREGRPADAARAQDQAQQALSRASQAAREGQRFNDEQSQAQSRALGERERQLREEVEQTARELRENEQLGLDLASLDEAAEALEDAQQALEEQRAEDAGDSAEEARRELEQAADELEEEEQRYESLREEELLFRTKEELINMSLAHEEARAKTLELDTDRAPGDSPSRALRLALRRVARDEGSLATRASELIPPLEEEGSFVFAEALYLLQSDLERIADDMDQAGGYRSGESVQGLQADVADTIAMLIEALTEQLDNGQRERDEEQRDEDPNRQEQDREGQQGQPENNLVPDVAELKVLRRMEQDLNRAVDQLLMLYPELAEGSDAPVDPLALEDIQRLASRHARLTELFAKFREGLGLPDPNAETEAGGR